MSHTAQQNGAAAPGEEDGELYSQFDGLYLHSSSSNSIADGLPTSSAICPVCKSSRYLNPKMRFLLNPECYHKMCESCVDRIFSQGPAPCPVAGCGKTLRKARFKKQTFEDVKVEREVDIRRRVASMYILPDLHPPNPLLSINLTLIPRVNLQLQPPRRRIQSPPRLQQLPRTSRSPNLQPHRQHRRRRHRS